MNKLLFPTLALLAFARPVQAQTVTPNPAPTIITSAPYTISANGYYQLGANLTVTATSGDIITINAGNVTLDFGGHYISGPDNTASTLVGVHANERGNILVQNGTVSHCLQGILLEGNGQSTSQNYNQRVQNMLVTHCYECGIQLSSAANSVIANNRISFIVNGFNVSSIQGIYDRAGTADIVDSNIITNVNNSYSGGLAFGIAGAQSDSSTSLTVTNNRVNNVTASSADPLFGIGIYEGAFVTRNTVNNAYQAIYTSGKYQDNLTLNTTDAFGGGTDAGGNN